METSLGATPCRYPGYLGDGLVDFEEMKRVLKETANLSDEERDLHSESFLKPDHSSLEASTTCVLNLRLFAGKLECSPSSCRGPTSPGPCAFPAAAHIQAVIQGGRLHMMSAALLACGLPMPAWWSCNETKEDSGPLFCVVNESHIAHITGRNP